MCSSYLTELNSVQEMYRDTLAHEQKVTALINAIGALANEVNDFATANRMAWFIDEQVEEEENAREMLASAEAVEDNKYGMYMLDKELAGRTYTTPGPLASK